MCPIKISVASVDHFEAKENLERKKRKRSDQGLHCLFHLDVFKTKLFRRGDVSEMEIFIR